jgi:hypothetical protein
VNQYFNACQWKAKTRKNEGNLITIQETSQPKKSRENTDEVNYYMKTTSTLSSWKKEPSKYSEFRGL